MSNYGIPYMGSKDKIIASIAINFPKADHFYDLFGGGFSVTHYMLKNKHTKYTYFHYNEIKSDIVDLVKRSINGEYNYNVFKPRWISRDEFFKNKDLDAYIRICWSFGNNQRNYMFSPNIEPYKRSMHMAVVFDEFNDLATAVLGFNKWPENTKSIYQKRIYLRQKIEWYRKTKIPKVLYQFLDAKQLLQLERLQQLERLHQLEKVKFYSDDYRNIDILPNSIVYCDIPYKNTADYGDEFNHSEFFEWAATRKFPVYISEFNIDDDRFKCIYSIDRRPMLRSNRIEKSKVEKLYWNGK